MTSDTNTTAPLTTAEATTAPLSRRRNVASSHRPAGDARIRNYVVDASGRVYEVVAKSLLVDREAPVALDLSYGHAGEWHPVTVYLDEFAPIDVR